MRRVYVVLLSSVTIAAVVTLGAVAIAQKWMSPMVAQTSETLARNYWFDVWSPRWTVLLLVLGVVSIVALWRHRVAAWTWRSYVGAVGCLMLLAGAVGATHVKRIEIMLFKPLSHIEHVPIAELEYDAADGPVMGVEIDGEARAYPVKVMAYHHIANDVVGQQPIVATY